MTSFKIFRSAFDVLTASQRKGGLWIVTLMILTACVDFLSLASFFPLLLILINGEALVHISWANAFMDLFDLSSTDFILLVTSLVLLFSVGKYFLAVWASGVKAKFTFDTGSELSVLALSRYLDISYLNFTRANYANELNRISNLPIAFANNIVLPMANLVSESVVCALLILSMILYDTSTFFLVMIFAVPLGLYYRSRRRQIKKTGEAIKKQYPLSIKYALQAVEGLADIRAFRKESFFKKKFKDVSEQLGKAFAHDHTLQTSSGRISELFAAFVICPLIIYAVLMHRDYKDSILLLGVYAGIGFRLIPSLNRILNALLQLQTHAYLFEELKEAFKYEINTSQTIPLSFQRSIEIKDVSFHYPEGPPVLDKISFAIQRGEKIAITGKSGSGKTTILLLLLRYLHEGSGFITIDGIPINSRHRSENFVAYVPQNPFILDASLLENVAFGVPASEVDREKVSSLLLSLDLSDLLGSLPQGLDSPLGERGALLSGGQRQRIAIARALYSESEVLLLDEITNQLDAATEREIINTLEKVTQGNKTMLLVTHHESLIRRTDRILHLEDGRLTERSHG